MPALRRPHLPGQRSAVEHGPQTVSQARLARRVRHASHLRPVQPNPMVRQTAGPAMNPFRRVSGHAMGWALLLALAAGLAACGAPSTAPAPTPVIYAPTSAPPTPPPETVMVEGGPGAFDLTLLDAHGGFPPPWPWQPVSGPGGPPYLATLAPGQSLTSTQIFQVIGPAPGYDLWADVRFARVSQTNAQ